MASVIETAEAIPNGFTLALIPMLKHGVNETLMFTTAAAPDGRYFTISPTIALSALS